MRRLILLLLPLFLLSWQPDARSWLIIIHAKEGTIMNDQLILEETGKYASFVAESPTREARAATIPELVRSWKYFQSKPNAAIVYEKEGEFKEMVVALGHPRLYKGKLIFPITPKKGHVLLGETVLYIDPIIPGWCSQDESWLCRDRRLDETAEQAKDQEEADHDIHF